jgi:lipopolysaccharide export system protein LptA
MKHKNLFKIVILIIFVVVIFLVIFELKPREKINQITEFEPDGINMTYTIFNKENKKRLEVSCIESKTEGQKKMIMKKINGTIFKKGELDQDISISGESGYVDDNFNKFYVEKKARIYSKDMDIKSDNFFLKGKAQLMTENPVNYNSKGLKGTAKKGMLYLIRPNVLKLFDTRGIYSRGENQFTYDTTQVRFSDPNKTLVFQKNTVIRNQDSILKSNQLKIQFSEDLDVIRRSTSFKNSYFYGEDVQKQEIKEIQSRFLENQYDETGKLQKTIIRKNARVLLKDLKNNCDISSQSIILTYKLETGNISSIRIHSQAKVDNIGKTNFSISAENILLDFKNGEMKKGQAEDECKFKIEDYTGETDKLTFDIDSHIIHLKGIESTIKKEKNTFISSDFYINTEADKLNSSKGIKSILKMKTNNALFSKDSIFINAHYIEIFDKENRVMYRDQIRLHQNDTILKSDQLEILNENNLKALGKVFLSFKNNQEDIILQGDGFYFDATKKTITIKKNGVINNKNRILKADSIQISFNQKNELSFIKGKKDVVFIKDNITGKADEVNWLFNEELLTFINSAEIKNKSGSVTKGNELKFDLKNNKILIISDQSIRSETIIE